MLVAGIFLIVVGIFMLARPSLVWSLTESWKSNDATDPSDLYIFSTRFGGTICTLAGIALILAFILL